MTPRKPATRFRALGRTASFGLRYPGPGKPRAAWFARERSLRADDAINLLLKNGHASEAVVLTLPQFELRFDLAYTALK